MFIIQLMIGIIASVGIGYILCDVLQVPSMKAAKTARNAASKGEKKKSSLAVFLDGFAEEIQDKIKLNQWKEQEIQTDLDAAGIKDEPRLFVAKALTKACAVGILAIPAFFIFKILGLAVLAFAVFVYFNETKGITRKIKKKRAKIEAELPRFVSFVNNKLSHTRDLISILRSYKETAGAEFKEELETTIVHLEQNRTEALTNLEQRVGSPLLNEVTMKLKAVENGTYNEAAWTMLATTFSSLQKDNLKKKALSVPRKVRKGSMALLFCFILIYAAVLGQVLLSSLGTLF